MSGTHLQVERPIGSRSLRVFGSIAAGAPPNIEEIAIDDPAEFAALALKTLLADRGITVDGRARARHRPAAESRGSLDIIRQDLPTLPSTPVPATPSEPTPAPCVDTCPLHIELHSPTLADDVTITLKTSQNLHAEMLLRHLGQIYAADGSAAEGARVLRQFLLNAGLDPADFIFFDGSGLSGHDLVTPRANVHLLTWAGSQPWFAAWKNSLPIAGEDGTLATRFLNSPVRGNLLAKTGTLGEARALSGYLRCAGGRTVALSIMVTSHAPGSHADQEVIDRIVSAIWAAE